MTDKEDVFGPTQERVLMALDEMVGLGWPPVTPREIAEYLWGPERLTSNSERVNSTLRSLERRGYVERLGVSASGGRCWRLVAQVSS